MADVHSQEIRSFNMSRIRGKDTKPEMLVRRFLFAKGFRYKLHDKSMAGKPDIVLPKYKTVVFIHGCFWHGHQGCKYFVIPKTRTEWWLNKITKNIENDLKSSAALKLKGWRVLEVWECQLKKNSAEHTLANLVSQITA